VSQLAPTIGLLYPGEMGAALAGVLRARGLRVVTTLADRGPETAVRCRESGIVVLESFADVVGQSDVVISVVLPAAAEEVAAEYCKLAHMAPQSALFVDANSIGPELVTTIAGQINAAGRDFVDAAVNGLAKNLTKSGTLFLSGNRADEIAKLFEPAVHVRVLGVEVGRASAMKMLLGGLSKGLCALFAELALLANRREMLGEMIDESSRIYPGLMLVVDRMLPTYALHAGRRATEMNELEETARSAGLEPCVIEAVRRLHEELAAAPAADVRGCTVASLIKHLAAEGVLGGGGLVTNGKEQREG
jgi:3-hydroxyisobutyrate dehydrogenase-like beta-hydroxyacid dehydrogenase